MSEERGKGFVSNVCLSYKKELKMGKEQREGRDLKKKCMGESCGLRALFK